MTSTAVVRRNFGRRAAGANTSYVGFPNAIGGQKNNRRIGGSYFLRVRGCKKILISICNWWNLDSMVLNYHPFYWASILNLKGDARRVLNGVLYIFIWPVRDCRNGLLFKENSNANMESIFANVQALSYFWFKNRSGGSPFKYMWSDWCLGPSFCF